MTQKEHLLKYEYQPISGKIKDIAWTEDSKRLAVCGEGREKYVLATTTYNSLYTKILYFIHQKSLLFERLSYLFGLEFKNLKLLMSIDSLEFLL